MRERFNAIFYSFPLQLVFHNVRRNLALVILWMLFVATISGGIGEIYGIHYLYLDPEYLNKVNFWSFFMVGLAFGNFTMAFHITCYILDSHRFTFVGILERPFTKFTINNSVIPLLSLVIYILLIVNFQIQNEFCDRFDLVLFVLGLISGVSAMMLFFFYYFRFTNNDIFKYMAGKVDKRLRKTKLSRERMMNKLTETRQRRYTVYTYLDLKLRVRSCKGLDDFYDKNAILKVFDQNHFNSVVIELAVILLILFLGVFMDNPYFQIPAAASSLLLFTIVVMLVGAFSYWLRGWGASFVFGLFLLVNFLVKAGWIKEEFQARGLDYDKPRREYSLSEIQKINTKEAFNRDSINMIRILENWKAKQPVEKPKFTALCVSGGGQRAALWTINALTYIENQLEDQQLMDKIGLITGASGGMIGAAYYRELFNAQRLGDKIASRETLLHNIGKDNLNPIIFSLLVNDVFFRFRKIEYNGKLYVKDRGYVFEENLNKNIGGILEKQLGDYTKDELEANLPLMLMSPVIANDGRKLHISTQGVSFMNQHFHHEQAGKLGSVDFRSLFSEHGADQLHFLTALRMSASFPYITPTVSLPSTPPVEIMDAGISDNYGISDAVRFFYVFRDWFDQNTSGVNLLVIRDTRKNAQVRMKTSPSVIDALSFPIASVYNNLGHIQDVNNDSEIERMKSWLNVPVNQVALEYNTDLELSEEYLLEAKRQEHKQLARASLSWHLTTKEKQNIIDNISNEHNQKALKRIWLLLGNE